MKSLLVVLAALIFLTPISTSLSGVASAQQLNEICANGLSQRTYTHYSSGAWEWIVYKTGGGVASRQRDDIGYPASKGSPKHFEDVCNNGHWFRNVAQYY